MHVQMALDMSSSSAMFCTSTAQMATQTMMRKAWYARAKRRLR